MLVNAISAMQEAEHIAQTQRGKRRKAMQGIPNFAPPELEANLLEAHKRQMQQHYMTLQSLGGQAAAQPVLATPAAQAGAKKRHGRKRKAEDEDKDDSDSGKNEEPSAPAPPSESAEQRKSEVAVPELPQPPKAV